MPGSPATPKGGRRGRRRGPGRSARGRAEPGRAEPTPAAAIEVSGTALERLRSSTTRPDRVVTNGEDVPLSPNGNGHHAGAEPKPAQKSEPEARPGAPGE